MRRWIVCDKGQGSTHHFCLMKGCVGAQGPTPQGVGRLSGSGTCHHASTLRALSTPRGLLRLLQVLSQTVRAARLDPPAAQRMDENLTLFEDAMGTCERILRTPIPLSCGLEQGRAGRGRAGGAWASVLALRTSSCGGPRSIYAQCRVGLLRCRHAPHEPVHDDLVRRRRGISRVVVAHGPGWCLM